MADSALLSVVALGVSLILVHAGASRTSSPMHVFLVGTVLNAPRFIALGVVVGGLHRRVCVSEGVVT